MTANTSFGFSGCETVVQRGIGQLLPRAAAVRRLPDPAVIAGAFHGPAAAPQPVPASGVQDVRVRRIHDQVNERDRIVYEECVLPRLAPVGGLIDAALGARAPEVPHRRDVDDVRILRMHDDAADVAHPLERHPLELLAPVGGLIDAVTPAVGAERIALTGADPHVLRIGWRNHDVADRAEADIVRNRLPRHTAIGGLEHAARCETRIHRLAIVLRRHRDRRDAPRLVCGPDKSRTQWLQQLGGQLDGRCRRRCRNRSRRPERSGRRSRVSGLGADGHSRA